MAKEIALNSYELNEKYKKGPKYAYGIDVGGSGIKGAYVNLKTGKFASLRNRIPTPESGKDDIIKTIVKLVHEARVPDYIPIGVDFPGAFQGDKIIFAGNLKGFENSYIGKEVSDALGRKVIAMNDADAAAYAEVKYGAAKGIKGTVLVITLGTGIGSGYIHNGHLIPNLEFGHIEMFGDKAENYASSRVYEDKHLTFEQYAERLKKYFTLVNLILNPVRIVVGGGISKHAGQFLPHIKGLRATLVPAKLLNKAGIVGAAAYAVQVEKEEKKAKKKHKKIAI